MGRGRGRKGGEGAGSITKSADDIDVSKAQDRSKGDRPSSSSCGRRSSRALIPEYSCCSRAAVSGTSRAAAYICISR